MKKVLFIRKMTLHNLCSQEIRYQWHVDLFGFQFRFTYRKEGPKKAIEQPKVGQEAIRL